MIFIDNKYTKIYYSLINRAKIRVLPIDTYKEKHHIIPQSFFKSKSKTGWINGDHNAIENLVYLTAREHFICHLLLVRMTKNNAHLKMTYALKRFVYAKKHKQFINSRLYEYIRQVNSNAMKGRPCSQETREKIRQGNLNRLPPSEETRRKLSEAAKRRKGFTPEGLQNVINAHKGKPVSDETKQKLRNARQRQVERQGGTMTAAAREKLSKAAKGRILSDDHKQKIAESHKGKIISEETRQKMRQNAKNRTHSSETKTMLSLLAKGKPKKQLTCPHCSMSGGEPQMKRWHFDKCKSLKVNI